MEDQGLKLGAREAIALRSAKLSHLVLGRGSVALANKHLVSRDSLLDALLALYDECNIEQLRRDKYIALFLDKYRSIVSELRQLRVSIADFEVRKVIGRGHFGEVQMVKEKATGDFYAMKILRKADTLSQQNVAFYEEERDILARASQGGPWLTRLQYAFQDSSNLYLVMEFLPGGDLLGLLDRHDNILPEDMARFYLAEIVLAVHALHSLGYVHRDVKPDNILIDRTGHVKLADFGSAAKLTAKMSVCSRMPVGTPDYIAPEVLRAMDGGPASVATYGMGCDWWSLGVVAYEILFGQLPFSDDRTLVTYNNIMNFKKTLKFPEDVEVSESAVELIKGLLESADKRLSYDEICQHSFFSSVDWNDIRHTVPPFVPNLEGMDDTSNFDDFKQDPPRPKPVGLRDQKKGFEGRNLPFVGFTHTMCSSAGTMGLNRTASLLDVSSPLRNSFVESEANRKQRGDLQGQIAALTEKEERLRQEMQGTQARLKESLGRVATLEEELASIEKEAADLRADNQNLNSLLDIERKKRILSEEHALQLLDAIKRKYRRQDELLRSISPQTVPSQTANGDDVSSTVSDSSDAGALKEEVERLNQELSAQKSLCAKYKERLNMVLSQGTQCMLEVKQKQKSNAEYIEELRKQVSEAERRLSESLKGVEDLKYENRTLKQQLSSSRNKLGTRGQPLKLCVTCKVSQGGAETVRDSKENAAKEADKPRESKASSSPDLQPEVQRLRSVVAHLEETLASYRAKATLEQGSGDAGEKVQAEAVSEVLQRQARELSLANQGYVQEIQHLKLEVETLKARLTAAITASKTDDEKTHMVTPEALNTLEKELSRTKEFLSTSRSRCAELQQQLRKREDELSKAQLESRVAQRESARAKENEHGLREKVSTLEESLAKTKASEASLKSKVTTLEERVACLEREGTGARLTFETEKATLQERIRMLSENSSATKDLAVQCVSKSDECRDLAVKCQMLEAEVRQKTEQCERTAKELDAVRQELAQEQSKMSRSLTILESLKSSCEKLEDEATMYEELLKEEQEKNAAIESKRAAQAEMVESLNHKLKDAEERLLKERAARIRAEEDLAKWELDQESDRLEDEEELDSLRVQLAQKEAMLQDLSKQVNDLQRDLSTMEASLRAARRGQASLQEENIAIKEEASSHITTIASLKSSNLKLSHELEEANMEQKRAMECIERLEGEIDGQKSMHETELMKLKQTLAQQTKLIDFLQAKVSDTDKKKKKFFGGKTKTESSGGVVPRWTDAEKALDKERSKCRRLQEQLEKARAEVMSLREELVRSQQHNTPASTVALAPVPTSPKSRALLEALTYSPASGMRMAQGNPLDDSDSVDSVVSEMSVPSSRMQHNIPHRFQLTLCMRGVKCAACLDSVHFGRYASRCQECQVVCHPKCSTSIPSTCGVPAEYVQHFSDTVVTSAGPSVKFAPGAFDITFDRTRPQGWVKVRRTGGKQCWERYFMVLLKNTLYFLEDTLRREDQTEDEEEQVEVLESMAREKVDLCPPDGEAVVGSAVSAAELMGTVKSDLPYVLKVELKPYTTCWPAKCIYIMVPSFTEKQLWVLALEEAAKKNVPTEASKKRLGDTVLTLQGDNTLDMNCIYELSFEYLLLGAMEGLFVVDLVHSTLRRQVKGVPAVFQVGAVGPLNIIVAICGQDRRLRLTELSALLPWVETVPTREPGSPAPTWRPVDNMEECHLFAHSEDGETLCVATAKNVYILKWNPASRNYSCRKALSTNEPCSCLHFTKHTVLVGTDLFYEVDLEDYSARQFLDASDPSLAFLVYGATHLRSFPVSILQVAPPEMEPEYLLCFHELGVFVNSKGRRTRENDLKWSRLPLAFAYKVPYLFVGHFNSVEILEIRAATSQGGLHQFVEVSSPRFLGLSSFSGCMYLASFKDKQIEIICVNAKDTCTTESGDKQDDGLDEQSAQFSFTSSMEESMED